MKLVASYAIEKSPSHVGVVSGLYRCFVYKHYGDNFYLSKIPIFLAIAGLAAVLLGLE